MNSDIKLFMFDFAGVVATTKMFPAIVDYFAKRHILDTPEMREKFKLALYDSQYAYMLGQETTEAFWEKTGKKFGISLEQFIEAFEKWFVINDQLIALIDKLKEHHRVVLVSDNFAATSQAIRKHPVAGHFDKMYFSDEEHVMKGDGTLFSLVLEQEHIQPEEGFFVDDQPLLVEQAKKLGINAVVFENAEQLENILIPKFSGILE